MRESTPFYNHHILLTARPSKNLISLFEKDSTGASLLIPVTGISRNQALQYCAWREQLINKYRLEKLRVELPSPEIYKALIPNRDSLNSKKCPLYNWAFCNCQTSANKKISQRQGKYLMRADSYWPSDLGLYNLQGNAAEMTSVQGMAMGGSYRHPARESYSDKTQVYPGPEEWLGFRFIVILK